MFLWSSLLQGKIKCLPLRTRKETHDFVLETDDNGLSNNSISGSQFYDVSFNFFIGFDDPILYEVPNMVMYRDYLKIDFLWNLFNL